MGALVVIPARYGSTRFPGKPLALVAGKPMIQHVYEQAARATQAEEVVVATDDERILEAVRRFGGQAVMTSRAAVSGTIRAAEVARQRRAELIINVQGDEPLIRPEHIDQLAACLERHQSVPMASLMTPMSSEEELGNPNVVKVVVDRDGFALYFSRAPIPHVRDGWGGADAAGGAAGPRSPAQTEATTGSRTPPRAYKHLGVYGYQRYFLLQFPALEPTPLEQREHLEQLRALEHGYRIKLLETPHDTIGVDTPEDLKRAEALLAGSPRLP
jgi:3-deoxy-manno-octulosonate cytidylyltransferase (CMP-KDO synthetase)